MRTRSSWPKPVLIWQEGFRRSATRPADWRMQRFGRLFATPWREASLPSENARDDCECGWNDNAVNDASVGLRDCDRHAPAVEALVGKCISCGDEIRSRASPTVTTGPLTLVRLATRSAATTFVLPEPPTSRPYSPTSRSTSRMLRGPRRLGSADHIAMELRCRRCPAWRVGVVRADDERARLVEGDHVRCANLGADNPLAASSGGSGHRRGALLTLIQPSDDSEGARGNTVGASELRR